MTQRFEFDQSHIELNGHRLQPPGYMIGLQPDSDSDPVNRVMISIHHSSPSHTFLSSLEHVSNNTVSGIIRVGDGTDILLQAGTLKWHSARRDPDDKLHYCFKFQMINPPL